MKKIKTCLKVYRNKKMLFMKAKNKKKLILSLIKDDLINAKLVNGLNEIGLNADNYSLHLSDTIFNLMRFEDNEETETTFERYMELAKEINVHRYFTVS
ncbi:MAG: hypothetical protein IPI65_11005 [Bacteroidetes bacterium]|nr:hypothetical protein [Bacteroidota bacterium]